MRQVWALALALLVTALAGCAEDEEPKDEGPTAAECEAQGLVLGERDVMTDGMAGNDSVDGMDHSDHMDHETEPACVSPGPPATVRIDGLPSSVQAYTPVTFDWVLETDAEESHAMRTEVRFDTEVNVGACDPDAELQKPDDWGESAALKEHQNFVDGQSYNGTFTPTEPGNYCFRGYALVSQTNVWSDVYMLNVTAVQPTGVTHTVTASGGGSSALGGLDAQDLPIALGDAVAWETDDPAGSYSITGTGPESFSTSTGGDAVTFLIPGSYSYDAEGTLGTFSGTITVTAPTV